MNELPPPLERVISELAKLPTVGRKTAQRLALHLLRVPREESRALASSIEELREQIRDCERCGNLTDEQLCTICRDPRREPSQLCVVEQPTNLLALEATSAFRGVFHVLGGALSPLKDIGPEQLRIRPLIERARAGGIEEVILATNPDVEGEATAVYLARLLAAEGVSVTRLAQGLPAGGDLEFTYQLTLKRALEGRRGY